MNSNNNNSFLIACVTGCLVIFVGLLCFGVTALAISGYVLGDELVSGSATVTPFPATFAPATSTLLPAPSDTVIPATTIADASPAPIDTPTPPPAGENLPSPTPDIPISSLSVPASIEQRIIEPRHYGYLDNLIFTDYPVHDLFESANRLASFDFGPRTVTKGPYAIGDIQTFWVDDDQVDAQLLAITPNAYFWIDLDLSFNQAEVEQVAQFFDTNYYPLLVNLFGQEWRPGVDNDPHFSVLHVGGDMDHTTELGFFSSGDEYPNTFYSDSNEQEIIYLNMDNLELGEDLYYGTLVHEVEHLIQWNVDGNETTWLDEGLAQLAEIYVGLDTAETIDYLRAPETQLNTWNYEENTFAHYAGAYLFTTYVWEQLGEAATREFARHPANGIQALYSVLEGYRPDLTFVDFMGNWVAANFLDSPNAGTAYHYENLSLSRASLETRVQQTPYEATAQLPQFGTHYIELQTSGQVSLAFAGDSLVELVPVPAHSGSQMWFVPPVDSTDATLTQQFDLTGLTEATFTFWTWFDLEDDYDFAYLAISRDNGVTWTLLDPSHTTPGDYGPAFSGRSSSRPGSDNNGWVESSVSLNAYVGQPVLLRFEVLTDFAVTESGFALDDFSIPQLDYSSDVEVGPDGWVPAGFSQTSQHLPQQWSVQLIQEGRNPLVTRLPLDNFNQGQWTLDLGNSSGILAITPLTPFIYTPADYWLSIQQ